MSKKTSNHRPDRAPCLMELPGLHQVLTFVGDRSNHLPGIILKKTKLFAG